MKRSTLALSAVAVLAGFVALFLWITQPGQKLDRPQQAPTTAQSPTPAAPTRTQAQAPAQPAPRTPLPAPSKLQFRRLAVDYSKDLVEACLSFNAPLQASGVRYEDFVRIAPETKVAVRVADDRICLGGLAFGKEYKVELLAGLPGANNLKLTNAESVDVSLGERAPLVSLPGNGLVLPRESTAGLPITTINVEKVLIRVYRVSDRLLARISRDQLAEKRFSPYRLDDFASDIGTLVWKGEMAVKNTPNEQTVTAFPIRDAVKPWITGAYFVVAWNAADGDVEKADENSPRRYDYEIAGQWLIDSDIGMTTFQGEDGLTVYARSLHSTAPLANVTLTLIARNNEELGRATTDANGRAQFAPGLLRGPGGSAPVAVMAYAESKSDFNFLDLQKQAFDLSDRGVDGRASPGPVDAYLYTDRGIYRPGETVNVVALLRDRAINAMTDAPLTLVLKRPDGLEVNRSTHNTQQAGAIHLPVAISPTARRGMWSVQAYVDPKGAPVGQVSFSVEDFIPQKLKVTLSTELKRIEPEKPIVIDVESRFLYGAPGADLGGESEVKVTIDPNPYPQYSRFRFGLVTDKFEEVTETLTVEATDAAGKTKAEGALKKLKDTSLPLKARITVAIFEPGGRNTSDTIDLPVRTRANAIGLRPLFDGVAPYRGEAGFEVILLDAEGKRIAGTDLEYEFVREVWNYNWYRADGRWRWETFYRDELLTSGKVDALADKIANLRQQVNWGRYRLTVRDTKTGAATSYRFYAGWREQTGDTETPDTVTVSSDKQSYGVGEIAKIRIEAPFAGKALLVMANDKLFQSTEIDVPANGTTIDVPVSADWGAGAYALVTAYRPLNQQAAEKAPVRAIGLAWLAIDQKPRTLSVAIAAPDKILPRTKLELPIKVNGIGATGDVLVTVAAVDEGILQLTKFQSPSPARHFFAKRKLAVDIRDDYGQLLDGQADSVGRIRSGGDSAAGRGLEVVPIKVVSLFSGVVKVDANGEAKVPFDVPDFVGELRLMAVAFDKTRVGMGEGKLVVRDPVVADMTLPRFLAPGDRGRVAVLLHNVDGQPGAYRLKVEATGAVGLAQPVDQTVELPAGKRQLLTWPLQGRDIGIGKVALTLTGPGNLLVTREWQMQVRPGQAPMTLELSGAFAPGASLKVDKELLNQFVPGSVDVSLTVSAVGGIDIASLLRSLDRYPYGCLEQTTSRAFPLLFFSDLALISHVPGDKNITTRVQEAIYRVLDMQTASGAFGMWGAGDRPADAWLQVFVLDFLMQAKDLKYVVPESSIRRGLAWMRGTIERFDADSAAYAYYVLARAGLADTGQLRYFQDTQFEKINGPLGRGQIGAALALAGEKGRANLAFNEARDGALRLAKWVPKWNYYGTELRDLAALTVFAVQSGQQSWVPDLVGKLRREGRIGDAYTTTQEKTWILMAAHALMKSAGPLSLSADGKDATTMKDPAVFNLGLADVERGYAVKNTSDKALWSTVSIRGVPKDMLGAEEKGISIDREFVTLDGEYADLTKLKQNDRLVVIIKGNVPRGRYHEVALLDLLPAGFEIEAAVNFNKDGPPYPFMPNVTKARSREARDDRFFVSFTLGNRDYPSGYQRWWSYYDEEDREVDEFAYVHAYVVRAVTPGDYLLPAARIEDMYRPDVYARTETGRVIIAPRD